MESRSQGHLQDHHHEEQQVLLLLAGQAEAGPEGRANGRPELTVGDTIKASSSDRPDRAG